MDLFSGLILITSVHLLAAASPGPDFVLVTQQTLKHGKKAGLLCSLGISLGLSVHIIYSALGLAAVIANSSTLLWGIKILGASYLFYLGIQGLRATSRNIDPQLSKENTRVVHNAEICMNSTQVESSIKTITKGFFCNALNPKAPIYFVALFTVVLSPELPNTHLIIYGTWLMVIQLVWFCLVTLLFSRPRIHLKFQQMGHWIDKVSGGAMILLGIKVLTSKLE
ncbi:LysE family transporter [Thalassotalea sp. 1_MG-2023]|uniref:LysE family translocator n=1 Tax=Thalassotalea sp. 1_MG-2023 TaxID=3062680 RepID=UPI0026E3DBA7|nr:LysE family transporter [Thalassotalea sp. 1_MG-2023]MDO6428027.1 LysE family transporter [Thalassotalea sp. 1_MG-2023]